MIDSLRKLIVVCLAAGMLLPGCKQLSDGPETPSDEAAPFSSRQAVLGW